MFAEIPSRQNAPCLVLALSLVFLINSFQFRDVCFDYTHDYTDCNELKVRQGTRSGFAD